jgi:Flp pilus assembly protein TadD
MINAYPGNNVFAVYRRGVFLQRSIKKYELAVRELEVAQSMAPGDPRVLKALSLAYYRLGDHEKAILHAEKLVLLQPESISEVNYLATLYQVSGALGPGCDAI